MLEGQRLSCIGAGNMAEAIIAGLIQSGRVSPPNLIMSDIRPDRLHALKRTYGILVAENNSEAAAGSDIVLLAVEPQVLDGVLGEIAPSVQEDALVLSVAAGYPIARIGRHLPQTRRIVRTMPNTPSAIREGITALAYSPGISEEDVRTAKGIFESIGKVVEVEEQVLDGVTAVSGSGPAYVYVMIEALADGGVKMGLPRETAELLATQTLIGAARMVLESGEKPGTLKDRVASPSGTTIEGLYELERGCFRGTIMAAVESATKRSTELGLLP